MLRSVNLCLEMSVLFRWSFILCAHNLNVDVESKRGIYMDQRTSLPVVKKKTTMYAVQPNSGEQLKVIFPNRDYPD